MLVTLLLEDNIYPLDLAADTKIEKINEIAAHILGVNSGSVKLVFEGKFLDSLMTLEQAQVKEDDIISVEKVKSPAVGNGSALLNNPILQRLMQESQSKGTSTGVDGLSLSAQQLIEEQIKAQNIAENLANALEYHPESFGSVTMLYVPCKINEHSIKAFVDCVTEKCALKCELMRLLDTRFSGIAKGVGVGKILGRVHSVQLKLGNLHLPCTITVIEADESAPEMLLGLDMLKRHLCCIDLGNNVLRIANESVHFLPESEIPKHE